MIVEDGTIVENKFRTTKATPKGCNDCRGGIDKYPKSQLTIFTRNGGIVYSNEDYQNNWDGTNSAGKSGNFEKVSTGTFYYVLKLGGTNRTLKKFIYIGY